MGPLTPSGGRAPTRAASGHGVRVRVPSASRPWRARLPAALQRTDVAAFRWVARRHAPLLDAILPRLSRTADHSLLWVATGAVLAATGGRFGRRAAVRGLAVLGVTSAVVNLPVKLAARRARPVIDVVPEVRRLARVPLSTSFPSGHSASAAAFATGVWLECPRVAPVVGSMAAAVAFSRAYTGVHYPGDVLAGAAIGAGIAWASRHVWERVPSPGEQETPPAAPAPAAPLPRGEGLVVVANTDAGPALTGDPVAQLERLLPAARIRRIGADEDLVAVLRSAAAGAAALGIAGGDGSVSAAAAVARETGTPLVVVPAGTLNHLARDLGIGTVADAAHAVEDGQRISVDLGTLDGRSFCNVVCLGLYPELVEERERLRPRVGEWLALVGSVWAALRDAAPLRLEIDGRPRTVWLVFVGNCRYEGVGVAPAWRRRLDDGLIDLRIVDAAPRGARLRFLAAVATGTLERSPIYRRELRTAVRITSTEECLRITCDGEAFDGPGAFTVSKPTGSLTVYAPHRSPPAVGRPPSPRYDGGRPRQ